jgi:hypothetical protein
MRTVSGKRGPVVYRDHEIVSTVMALGFDNDRAIRIVAICQAFGVKSEALPDGLVTLRTVPGGFTMEVQR